MIHKVYEVDPLVCPKCGVPVHVIALIENQRGPPGDAKGIDGLKPRVRELTYHPVPDIA